MKKYAEYTQDSERENMRVLKYKDLHLGDQGMVYGSDGQAAYEARPVTIPKREEKQVEKHEPEYVPMPSALLFEDAGHAARRRRIPRVLSAALTIAVMLVTAVILFGLVDMSGELNELAVKSNAIQRELTELQKEETRLVYRLSSEMTELEMLDYAREDLEMEPSSSVNTVNLDFGNGERYEVGGNSSGGFSLLEYLTKTFRSLMNFIN